MKTGTIIITSALLLATVCASAQQKQGTQQKPLNKEITLEKDFVPVEKKATKKNVLPQVKKITPPAATQLNYTSNVKPTDVPTSIPTMMPYGYRTAHNFSDRRGYLDFGGGTHANFAASAGYRIIDSERSQLAIWAQHNSTWNGRNRTPLPLTERLKQKFNDNTGGLNFTTETNVGTLNLAGRVHYDSFNYYGGTNREWDELNKQSFLEYGLNAGWEGKPINSDFTYHASIAFNHAGYDLSLTDNVKGAKENTLNFEIGGTYALAKGVLGLDITGDYISHKADYNRLMPQYDDLGNFTGMATTPESDHHSPFILTISPYYKWESRAFRARAGADIYMGKLYMRKPGTNIQNNEDFHISPNVQLDVEPLTGLAVFADIQGGATLNTLSSLAAQNRYSDPLGRYFNGFSPIDGDAGVKIGPFKGFSAKAYVGYGVYKSELTAILPCLYNYVNPVTGDITQAPYHNSLLSAGTRQDNIYAATRYTNIKYRGIRFGAQLNYSYRSLADAQFKIAYSPSNDLTLNGWNRGSLGGVDSPDLIMNFDLRVNPISRLTIECGLDWRHGRAMAGMFPSYTNTGVIAEPAYEWIDMKDLVNLRAGASYRFDRVLTLWLRADNLLNRRQDFMPGMGLQRLSFIGGVGLVF